MRKNVATYKTLKCDRSTKNSGTVPLRLLFDRSLKLLKYNIMEDRHEDRLLGKILFKHYKLKKKIGEGSFGKIYIAININSKEEYAIKLVSKNFLI